MTSEEKIIEIKRLKDYITNLLEHKEKLTKKLQIAKTALIDIKDWEDDFEEVWDDQGARAIEALEKIEKI